MYTSERKRVKGGGEEEHKRLKKGEPGRERWVAEEAGRDRERWRH